MNDTIRTLLNRRSIRSYTDKIPDCKTLEAILEAGTYAPNGMGAQDTMIICVTDPEVRDTVRRLNATVTGDPNRDPFYGAPVVALVFANRERPTHVEDGALVTGNICNAAYALGVDSCYIFRAKEAFESEEGRKLAKSWGVPDNYIGVGTAILGYHKGDFPKPAPRKANFVKII
ncbi:MAG TPA: nitroreductase family protein [Clostridiales bacterium]|jgi:nitroreductase|nr:nitroreductase family protein [Clostridiales bacterium]